MLDGLGIQNVSFFDQKLPAFLGIVAAGMMVVILLGHIDLSVPWTLAAAAMMATAVGGPLAIPIGIGIGLGYLGLTWHQPALVVIGFTGAILHVLNHALFKCLLFYAAGAVYRATHTIDLERLGGLRRSDNPGLLHELEHNASATAGGIDVRGG